MACSCHCEASRGDWGDIAVGGCAGGSARRRYVITIERRKEGERRRGEGKRRREVEKRGWVLKRKREERVN